MAATSGPRNGAADEQPRLGQRPAWQDFAHTGPGTLAGRYMRTFWHPVYIAENLPAGRAKPVRIMGEDLTLYRGESGAPHAVAFRCAHRGTQLSTGWVEGDNLRCFYHGWTYGPDGQCVEQPAEPEPFCQKIKIRSYPVQNYLGLIFVYLGEGEPPPLPRYPDFENGEGVLQVGSYVRDCNYFNNIENGCDPVHTAFAHRSATDLVGVPQMAAEESDFGITMYATRPGESVKVNQYGMPNLLLRKAAAAEVGAGGTDALSWRVPIDDERHLSFNLDLLHVRGDAAQRTRERRAARAERLAGLPRAAEVAQAVLRGELHVDDVEGRPDVVNIQDIVAQAGQGAIPDPQGERLGRSDAVIVLLRQIWMRELRALAEGRPRKAWVRMDDLVAARGV